VLEYLESWRVGKLENWLTVYLRLMIGVIVLVDSIFAYLIYALLMESSIGVMRSMTCVSADMHH
jgi:phage shock protein PspC (stress-responsive transcriptional regulator)